jgi:hypothetical protein
LAQVGDLREFAQATEAGEGTMHLEDALRHREIRRGPISAIRAGRPRFRWSPPTSSTLQLSGMPLRSAGVTDKPRGRSIGSQL